MASPPLHHHRTRHTSCDRRNGCVGKRHRNPGSRHPRGSRQADLHPGCLAALNIFVTDAGPTEFGTNIRDDDVSWLEIVRDARIQPQ